MPRGQSRSSAPAAADSRPVGTGNRLAWKHVRFGWWSLLVFLSLGIGLELLHGFKVRWYLEVDNETRRLMFTLAHAHGTLLSVLNIVYGLTLCLAPPHPESGSSESGSPAKSMSPPARLSGAWESQGLYGATCMLPAGFFLGGLVIHGGDPGLGILLVPPGGLLLLLSVFGIARRLPRP